MHRVQGYCHVSPKILYGLHGENELLIKPSGTLMRRHVLASSMIEIRVLYFLELLELGRNSSYGMCGSNENVLFHPTVMLKT